MSRLSPRDPPYPERIAELLSRYPKAHGQLLGLFRTFANSTRFLEKGVPNLLDAASPLDLRQRELVILRVTANLDCEYEWGVHVSAFAQAAELTAAQIAATRQARADASCWTPVEQALLLAVDQLCADGRITGAALAAFEAHWSCEQQLEVMALCGAYHTVSFVANTAKLEPEPFAARFTPADARSEKGGRA